MTSNAMNYIINSLKSIFKNKNNKNQPAKITNYKMGNGKHKKFQT